VTATHTGAVPTPHARCVRDTHRRCLLATTSRLERDGQRPIVQALHAGGALEVLSAISRSAQPLTPGVPDSDSTSYARCVCDTHRRHMLTAPWGLERDRASTSNIKCVCDTHRRHTRAAPLRSGAWSRLWRHVRLWHTQALHAGGGLKAPTRSYAAQHLKSGVPVWHTQALHAGGALEVLSAVAPQPRTPSVSVTHTGTTCWRRPQDLNAIDGDSILG